MNTFRPLYRRLVHYAIGSADDRQSTYYGVVVLVLAYVSLTGVLLHIKTRHVYMLYESYVRMTPYMSFV